MLKIKIMTVYLQIFYHLNNFFNNVYIYGIVLRLTIKNLSYTPVLCNFWSLSQVFYVVYCTPDVNGDVFKKIRNLLVVFFISRKSSCVVLENMKEYYK